MARRRSQHGTTGRTAGRRSVSSARRSAAARKGWQTRRANAAKRSAAARKGWKTRQKNERKKTRQRFKLKREKDIRRKSAIDFPFGANVMPAPTERPPQAQRAIDFQEEPDEDVIDDLYDFIEEYDDAEDYDEPIEVEVTPSYKGRGK